MSYPCTKDIFYLRLANQKQNASLGFAKAGRSVKVIYIVQGLYIG